MLRKVSVPRLFFFLALLLLPTVAAWRTTTPIRAQEQEASELDKQLEAELGGSDSELLGLDDEPKSDRTAPADDASRARKATDDDLLQDLDVGEDIQLGPDGEPLGDAEVSDTADPITRIGQKMRLVEQLLARREAADKTKQLQDQIVKDLEALIKECQNKKQGGGSSSQKPKAKQQASRSKVKQPGKQRSKPKAAGKQESKQPADDSQERLGKAKPEIDLAQMDEVTKEIWGHLPEKVREQLRQMSKEDAMPNYEEMIQRYFRFLSEHADESP